MIWGEGALDAFEHVGWGGILLGPDGNVIGLNKEAQRHVGHDIEISDGRVVTAHESADVELQHLIADALSAESGRSLTTRGAVLLSRQNKFPLMAYVLSIAAPGADGAQSGKAMIVLVDTERRRAPAESVLRHAFGLSPAEARVAIAFAGGRDLQAIADDRGISIGTVRKYFKAVLAKTNTSRQAELAILLAHVAQRPEDQPALPPLLERRARPDFQRRGGRTSPVEAQAPGWRRRYAGAEERLRR